ncbi:MAG: carboxypeptidase regulatory-like domain-containing protein [Acidobacteria bacterium]|nr:carboxypeptidase regulatory-like domain-containing protein [Acidobacteriota bacterium]
MLFFCLAAAAQQPTGSLSGVVTDQPGAVIPGAIVTIKPLSTGQSRSVVTDASGSYRYAAVPPGQYEVVEPREDRF